MIFFLGAVYKGNLPRTTRTNTNKVRVRGVSVVRGKILRKLV